MVRGGQIATRIFFGLDLVLASPRGLFSNTISFLLEQTVSHAKDGTVEAGGRGSALRIRTFTLGSSGKSDGDLSDRSSNSCVRFWRMADAWAEAGESIEPCRRGKTVTKPVVRGAGI